MLVVVSRKKIIGSIVVVLLILAAADISIISIPANVTPKLNTIVIDPGHGGRDPGALGTLGKNEKDINLEISDKIKKLLEQSNYKVIMTRDEDESIHSEGAKRKKASELQNRKKVINESSPELAVSIHLNSFPQKQYYGAQVFYNPDSKESKKLAETIQSQLKNIVDPNNKREAKGIKTAVLLKNLKVPAVIVECGFLSNEKEEKLLNNDEYQNKLAQAIFTGIIKYKSLVNQ